MNLHELELIVGEGGKRYSEQEVVAARRAYGSILPGWYANLWTQAGIFEKTVYVRVPQEDDPASQIQTMRLDGPDDGWKKDDQTTVLGAGYFTIGTWFDENYWLLVRSDSTDPDCDVWIIDHECMDDLDDISEIEDRRTVADLLDNVVDWPILKAIELWREVGGGQGISPDETGGCEWDAVVGALEGRASSCDPDILPPDMWAAVKKQMDDAWHGSPAGAEALESDLSETLGSYLPRYREEDIPLALHLFHGRLGYAPLAAVPEIVFGQELLCCMQHARRDGLPDHMFVFGRDPDGYMCLDMRALDALGDGPVVRWPGEQRIADGLAEWLLMRLERLLKK